MMGIFIFLTAFIIEVIFAIFCINTKSSQKKIKSIIRIGEFVVFVLLFVLSVIQLDFTYYALAALLFLFAAIGTIYLIRKKEGKNKYKKSRCIIKTIGMIILIFIVTLPAILFPQYKDIKPTGKYQVATAYYTYTDKNRIETYTNTGEKRKLNVEFWYPKNAHGTYPLIVFSHGALGIKTSNETLYDELASHGYVICSIDHTYQAIYTTDSNGKTIMADSGYKKELNEEDAHNKKQQSYELYQKWMKIRTGDINFVMDYILGQSKNSHSNKMYKLVDGTKIGVMGHSLGGSAVLGIGRMRKDVSAVISLEAPFMCDIEGVKNNKFVFNNASYPVPVLNVYSDTSWGHLGDWPQYLENYKLLSNINPKAFNVHITGVGHFGLTDFSLTSPILTDIFDGHIQKKSTTDCLKIINKVCLQFFDCYLKGQGKFKPAKTY